LLGQLILHENEDRLDPLRFVNSPNSRRINMSFCWRLAALVALMSVVAWIDWRRHGERATRWREYSFLLVAGMLGGSFGVGIDQLTSTISPEYFIFGKGIPHDDAFRVHVASLGFQAGFVMGMLVGGIYLLANNPRPGRTSLSYGRLFRFGVAPIIAAAVAAPISALAIDNWDPLNLARELRDVLSPAEIDQFRLVWGIHVGLYVGGVIGTAVGVVKIRRSRTHISESADAPRSEEPPADAPG
jgi:hypothetical protein